MKWKKTKVLLLIVLSYLFYMIAGAILPFAFPKEAEPVEQHQETAAGTDRAVLVETNEEALDLRIQMIQGARERIILSTFNTRADKSGTEVFAALQAAAARGVQVQVFVDGLYGTLHMNREPLYYAVGGMDMFEIRFYNIPSVIKPWTLNGRMHDKYIIVDDRLLLAGGRNTVDYFLGESTGDNPSYDREVLIYNTNWKQGCEESVISQTEEYFKNIWELAYSEPVYEKYPAGWQAKVTKAGEVLEERYRQLMSERPELFTEPDYEKLTTAVERVDMIHNPTHIMAKEPLVWEQVKELCRQADKKVYIQSPYAVLSKDMEAGMLEIAEAVPDFSMQVNSTAVGDNFMASSDYTLHRKDVLATGVQLFEFQGEHSSHGKSFLIDDDISIIGSYNMDMRSTYVNTESLLVIRGREFNKQLEEKIMNLHEQSLEVAEDGGYVLHSDVEPVPLPLSKEIFLGLLSILVQPFRYLL